MNFKCNFIKYFKYLNLIYTFIYNFYKLINNNITVYNNLVIINPL